MNWSTFGENIASIKLQHNPIGIFARLNHFRWNNNLPLKRMNIQLWLSIRLIFYGRMYQICDTFCQVVDDNHDNSFFCYSSKNIWQKWELNSYFFPKFNIKKFRKKIRKKNRENYFTLKKNEKNIFEIFFT